MSSLSIVYLRDTNITSKSLDVLRHAPIQSLDLAQTSVDDSAIDNLIGMQTLRYLTIEETGISKVEVDRLRKARPDLQVIAEVE